MTHLRQFALPFETAPQYRAFDFFEGPCNAAALAWLDAPALWPGLRLAVFGAAGSGKTHFLHVFAERHGAVVLPGAGLRRFMDLPGAPALAVDDADCAPEPRALLHLMNAAAEAGVPLLLAGVAPPSAWGWDLPDVMSRLRATSAVGLGQPDDALLRALLARLFADSQLAAGVAVQEYLLARLPRSGGALREAVARLDRVCLAAGRRVSQGLAEMVVAEMGEG